MTTIKNITKADRIAILQIIKTGGEVPHNEKNNFILLDLIEDGAISIANDPFYIGITYFGLQELMDWDPILEVTIDKQLIQCRGNA